MDGEGVSGGLSAERRVEIIRLKKNGRKVIVEKSAAEGLPEGWIKKLVITFRSGRKNRRDPFFIDPKSEYIFHSFKDASRYVETGDIGNYARKVKESDIKDGDEDDSVNGKNNRTLESLEKRSEDDLSRKEKSINFYVRRGKMNSKSSIVTSEALEDVEKKEEENVHIEKQPIAKRVTRSQAKANKNKDDFDLKRKNPSSSSNAKAEEGSKKPRLMSASSQDSEKESVIQEEDAPVSTEKRIIRSKAIVKKNDLTNSIPRRSSKRLAGIELEPTPELKTRTKPQHIVSHDDLTAEKSEEPVTPVATCGLQKTNIPLDDGKAKSYNQLSSPKLNAAATSNSHMRTETEKICKPVRRNGSGDKKMPLVISEEEFALNPVFQLDGYKQEEEMSHVSPLSRQTPATKREKTSPPSKRLGRSSPKANKPTIPKATKTSPLRSSYKGDHPYDKGNTFQKRNISSNSSSMPSVARGACTEAMEKSTNSFSSAYDSTLADIWKDPCIAFAIKTLTGESLHPPNTLTTACDPSNNKETGKRVAFCTETPTSSVKPGASIKSPGMGLWKDPCIDFAIKTLTGAIPTGLDTQPKSKVMTVNASATREAEGKAKDM